MEGFEKFKEAFYSDTDAMQRLVEDGQAPDYFIISCIDSRANPATVFQTEPGKFFGFKAMGAIVRLYKQGTALSAALQFAINYMKVKKVIVLGHTQCGAIQALAEKLDDTEIASFIDVAKRALVKANEKCSCPDNHEELLARTEQETVLMSLENLKTYPAVANALKQGAVSLEGWIFDMKAGEIVKLKSEKE